MTVKFYGHPFSSFCQKVLIAFYENGTPFEPHVVNLMDALRESLSQVKATPAAPSARRAAAKPKPARARIIKHPAQPRKRAS